MDQRGGEGSAERVGRLPAHQWPMYTGASSPCTSKDSANTLEEGDREASPLGMDRQSRNAGQPADLGLAMTKSEGGAIYIEFAPDDPENPFNWASGESYLHAVPIAAPHPR